MKARTTLFFTVAIVINSFAQDPVSPDSLDKKLAVHFEKYEPELVRYSGLTSYGEAKSSFSHEQMSKEIQLLNEVKNSTLLSKPSKNVFSLCHNILIHSSNEGKEFLMLLNKPTADEHVIGFLYTEIIFTGEFGERLALDNLESNDPAWSKVWAEYLSRAAIYESSLPRIENMIQKTTDNELQQYLIGALMYISNPKSLDVLKQIIDTTSRDKVQAKAIYAFTELAGYDGIKYLESINPVGPESKEEKEWSKKWLNDETGPKNKYGMEVKNDISFIDRFGDIKSPAIIWLDKEGLLDDEKANHPTAFTEENKNKFLDLLIESKGFGLEAAKAQLFLSINQTDIEKLLTLRQMCVYSPNNFTKGRLKTIGICVRYLRKTTA